MKVWRLKKGCDQRVRAEHPWVFSNELQESPKGIEPGTIIELQDVKGQFLARGYGHPNSLISFRVLDRLGQLGTTMTSAFFFEKFKKAAELRLSLGEINFSHRFCFAEADGLPGLIIDRYRTLGGRQAFVVQAQTAGIDRYLPEVIEGLHSYVDWESSQIESALSWGETGILIKNDSKMRSLEGLKVEEPREVVVCNGLNFLNDQIVIRSAFNGKPLSFRVSLKEGQKTGFFLDQASNVKLLIDFVTRSYSESHLSRVPATLKSLDLCCYVGQWSAQLAFAMKSLGVQLDAALLDASQTALNLADENVREAGGRTSLKCGNVFDELLTIQEDSIDVTVCDPPAFIKSRKDLHAGQHAYMKLNDEALRITKVGGWFISCSCSGLMEESDFLSLLNKSARRAGKSVQWLARGFQAPDHPVLASFPEGQYLKCWIGRVSSKQTKLKER